MVTITSVLIYAVYQLFGSKTTLEDVLRVKISTKSEDDPSVILGVMKKPCRIFMRIFGTYSMNIYQRPLPFTVALKHTRIYDTIEI